MAEAGPVPTKQEKKVINEEIKMLKEEIAAKDKEIKGLTKEVAELRKPMQQRSDELIQKLVSQYQEVQKLSQVDPIEDKELHEKMFKATEVYMNHVNEYYKNAYNLDSMLLEEMNIVESYYFPFIYNNNRNAQLNYKFYTDYKDNFLPGGP